jgi:hypothetical protein
MYFITIILICDGISDYPYGSFRHHYVVFLSSLDATGGELCSLNEGQRTRWFWVFNDRLILISKTVQKVIKLSLTRWYDHFTFFVFIFLPGHIRQFQLFSCSIFDGTIIVWRCLKVFDDFSTGFWHGLRSSFGINLSIYYEILNLIYIICPRITPDRHSSRTHWTDYCVTRSLILWWEGIAVLVGKLVLPFKDWRNFEKISKSDIKLIPRPQVEGFQKYWYHLKACLSTFQMCAKVMGFQWSRKITNIFAFWFWWQK